jgi:hypothetical protein
MWLFLLSSLFVHGYPFRPSNVLTIAYDGIVQMRIAYDGSSLPTFDYGAEHVHTNKKGGIALAGNHPRLAKFLAAEGVVYNATDDFGKIVASGRVWGQTEGSVYGMRSANAPRWRTMANPATRDAGTIIFEGDAASLFHPHPVEGPYSGLKRPLGQQKAGFGDIVIDQFTRSGSTLRVTSAHLASHAGQSTTWAAVKQVECTHAKAQRPQRRQRTVCPCSPGLFLASLL